VDFLEKKNKKKWNFWKRKIKRKIKRHRVGPGLEPN
jgi:hypothetical protein